MRHLHLTFRILSVFALFYAPIMMVGIELTSYSLIANLFFVLFYSNVLAYLIDKRAHTDTQLCQVRAWLLKKRVLTRFVTLIVRQLPRSLYYATGPLILLLSLLTEFSLMAGTDAIMMFFFMIWNIALLTATYQSLRWFK